MIKVTVERKDNYIQSFELSGHADSGPKGYDLVCAGVSAVSFGSINAILSLCEIDLHIEQAKDGGYLFVRLPALDDQQLKDKVDLLLEAMIVSLQTIEREYSEHIRIKEK